MLVDHAEAVVDQVAVFPLKGAGSAATSTILLDVDGVVGDRRHAVVDAGGEGLTADRAPRLRDVRAGLDGDGTLRLDVPRLGEGLTGHDAEAALAQHLGRPVRIRAVPAGSQLDAPVHLVSAQDVRAALRGEHEVADCACSLEEPRANLVVSLADPSAREESWVGAQLAAGQVRLRVRRRPGHSLGVYADVIVPGRVDVGVPVARIG